MSTFPLSFPARSVATEKLQLFRRQGVNVSSFNLAQSVVNAASQWRLEWTWPPMSHPDAEVCQAWLDSLQGQAGTFLYQPWQAYGSSLTGITLALQGYATNDAVSAGGWTANAPSTLRVGQLVQIGSQLLRITSAPVAADVNGQLTISFEPSLRINIAAGSAIEFVAPQGLFRLSTSDGYAYTLDPSRNPSFPTIAAQEAVEG